MFHVNKYRTKLPYIMLVVTETDQDDHWPSGRQAAVDEEVDIIDGPTVALLV